MPFFKKKPIPIEARQWLPGNLAAEQDVIRWLVGYNADFVYGPNDPFAINTLEGKHTARPGDWVIRGVRGEFYFCKQDIFEETYEPA